MKIPVLRSVVLLAAAVAPLVAQEKQELFPQAFTLEHQLIERERDGTVFYGEPVRDTYGGSWIVSERSDGSRLLIDLARREMTEIRPAEGVYFTIGFERFAELRGRIARLEGGGEPAVVAKAAGEAEEKPAELELIELSGVAARSAASAATRGGREELPAALTAPEIRRFAVKIQGSPEPGAEVWVDPRLRLGEAAQAALQAFEEDALGSTTPGPLEPARVMAAVRRQTAGALPVFTVLPVLRSGGEKNDGEKLGESEDRVLSAVRLEAFPAELARVPEGLARTSHPLESILAALEAQAKVDAALAGTGRP